MKRLYRSRQNRIIAGICGGIGNYFNVDPVMIRVLMIFLLFLGGGGIIAYIVGMVIIPPESEASIPLKKETAPRKSVGKTAPVKESSEEKKKSIQKHISLLGWIHIVFNLSILCLGIIIFAVITGGGILVGDETARMITTIVGSIVAGLFILFSIPGIICGAGLLKYRSWARILGLILGVLNLINIPLGTILGVYTLWVLLQPESEGLFRKPD